MSNRQRARITIHTTTRCNRGCRHCSFDSNMRNGTDFDCSKTEKLLKSLENIHLKANFCLTGGGEPLMNEQLPDITKIILASPITKSVSIVTSGFLNDVVEKNRLANIIENNNEEKIGVCISFHSHSSNYLQRFRNTLEFLIETKLKYIDIKVTIDRHDRYLHDELEEVLEKFDFFPLLVDYRDLMRRRMEYFERKINGEEYFDFLEDSAYLLFCWYANPKRKGILHNWYPDTEKVRVILVTTQLIQPRGRAKKLPDHAFSYATPDCPIYFFDGHKINLGINPNGSIRLYTSCNHPSMIIGTVDDDIKKLLRQRKIFKKNALKLLLSDKRMYDKKNSLCSLCPKIKAELDIRA